MIIELKTTKTVDVKYIKCSIGARYWEDGTVNDEEDTNGDLIPLREGDYWCPIIDLDTGIIKDWPSGTTADVHYKSCDDNEFTLLDSEMNVLHMQNSYVPDFLAINDDSFGDYVIMEIEENGQITDWDSSKVDLYDFLSMDFKS